MQCYTELIPPCGVTDAIWLPFTSATASNLIVARTSLLQIFSHKQTNNGQDTKLVLVAEYSLSGTITSLGRVKLMNSKSGGEGAIVALRNAKLSLIEWNAEQHTISTISIHYYENEDLQNCPWDPALRDSVTHLTVDPASRCAAFNFGNGRLAVLPFHQSGDDLDMEDDDEVDGAHDVSSEKETNGDTSYNTPYESSFVWPMTKLDHNLLYPVDLAFLYGLRQPTVGILYSGVAKSSTLQSERRDVTNFAGFALDVDQKSSSTVFTISRLPDDLYQVVPLPAPVKGALLVGYNELVHANAEGRALGVAVNEFAKQRSAFPMSDQSPLRMRLEGCQIEPIGSGDGGMLMVLASGDLALLTFRMDGSNVSGLLVQYLDTSVGEVTIRSRASCLAQMDLGNVFVGSEEGDSVLLGTARKFSQLKKHSSRINLTQRSAGNGAAPEVDEEDEQQDDEDEADDDDDDDLYADDVTESQTVKSGEAATLVAGNIRELDRLPSIAPIRDVAMGRPAKRRRVREPEADGSSLADDSDLDLVVANGAGRSGSLATLSREIKPEVIKSSNADGVNGVWYFSGKPRTTSISDSASTVHHNFAIHSKIGRTSKGTSILYEVRDGDLVEKSGTEFDTTAGSTIEVGKICGGSHTVQVLEHEVRVYDAEFGLAQIWPISDEDDSTEVKASSASFADPHVLIVKDDSNLLLLKADRSGELDEVETPTRIADTKAISAVLYEDTLDSFDSKRYYADAEVEATAQILVLLGAEGSLGLYSLYDLNIQLFYCEGAHFLTTILSKENQFAKHWKQADTLTEITMARIGDKYDQQTYMLIRNSSDDIVLYMPYSVPGSVGSFRFRRISSRRIATAPVEAIDESIEANTRRRNHSMRILPDIGGYTTVFVPGASPALILKHASSQPKVHNIASKTIKTLNTFHTAACDHGFVYVDDQDKLTVAQLPVTAHYGMSEWISQKTEIGEDVSDLVYFERTGSYVLATSKAVDFHLPRDDENHPEWQDEDTKFLPQLAQGSLKLFSPRTGGIISSHEFEPAERVLSVKSLNLEVSEETHERKGLIVVGTSIIKGENVTVRGNIYIFDVVDVMPEAGATEMALKLKVIAKEEVKGAVTAVSGVGSQGFVLAAQGQKCMVRGLKEDLSVLPVAFMDMRYYVQVAKELKSTGLCILGDAMSGLWLVGYSVGLGSPDRRYNTDSCTGRALQDAAPWQGPTEP